MKHLFLALTAVTALNATQKNVYERIGAEMLKNFSAERTKEKQQKPSQTVSTFCMPKLTLFEQHATLFEVMSTHEKNKKTPVDFDILNPTSAADLNLYFYNESAPEYNLVDTLYRGTTTLGKIAFARKMALPTANPAEVKRQQALTLWLINNPAAAAQLKTLFSDFKQHEEHFLSLWHKDDPLFSALIKKTFYGNNFHKWRGISGRMLLELTRRGGDFVTLFGIALTGGTIAAEIFGLYKVYQFYQHHRTDVGRAVGGAATMTVIAGATLWLECIAIKQLVAQLKSRKNIANHIRDRMKSMRAFNKLLNQIEEFMIEHGDFADLLPEYDRVSEFLNGDNNTYTPFLENLERGSFKNRSYFFSNIGRVLQSIPYFLQIRNDFAPLLEAVGLIDAQLSISQFYAETKDRHNGFVMVELLDNDTPTLNIQDFWHPLLAPEKAIPNSLSIGGGESKDVVLTGPNASGKSMTLKALVLCILLGQTIGIAPARSAHFTPYHKITTHLNVVDTSTDSLYKAEVLRARELINEVNKLDYSKKQFALNILDELLNSTAPIEGEAGALGIMYALGLAPHANSIIATHYAKLTTLPRHTNNIFANYKVSVIRNTDGTFDRPFKLEKGRSHQVIALDMIRNEGFDTKILDHAYQFLRDHPTAGMEAVGN